MTSSQGLRSSLTREEAAPIFAAAIARLTPIIDCEVQWPTMRLRVRTFIGDHPWPDVLASSARAVVFRRRSVVVVREQEGPPHINPGGRREPGETLEQTVRREVLEECGWHVGPLTPIGFHHLQPLGKPPPGHAYPWTDFIHPLHIAEGVRFERGARDLSQIEVGSSLVPIARALLELPAMEVALLRAAIAIRRASPAGASR